MRQTIDSTQDSNSVTICTLPIFSKKSLTEVPVNMTMQNITAPKPMHAPNRVESISLRACFIVAWYEVLTQFVCTNIGKSPGVLAKLSG